MKRGSALARAVVTVCLLSAMAAGCASSNEARDSESRDRESSSPPDRETLAAVSLPDLSGVAAPVRKQLNDAFASLTAKKEDAATTDADLGAAYGDMGKLLMAAQFRGAAEACFRNAEALDPRDRRWPHYLGHLYESQGNAERAADAFERALRLEADEVPTLIALGNAYLDQGRPADAAPLFEKALALQPRSVPTLFGLGRVALARDEHARAIGYFEEALALAPSAAVIHYPLALAYRGAGDAQKAAAQARLQGKGEVPLADPLIQELDGLLESAAAYELRGARALDERRWQDAVTYFRRAVELAPDDPSLRHKLGSALALAGNGDAAFRELEAVARRWPAFAKGQYSLGVLLAGSGRHRDAIARFEAAIRSDPNYVQARLQLADALRAGGRFEESLPHYERAAAADPRLAEAWFGSAVVLVRLTRYREARQRLDEAMQVFPDRPGFAEAMVRLLAAAPDDPVRDGPRAMVLVKDLMNRPPTFARAEAAAMAFAEVGQYGEAARWQREAIEAARHAARFDVLPRLTTNLTLYERGRPCRAPWGDEIAVATL
jgi:tetratricopeptide (TPR) repeat protein